MSTQANLLPLTNSDILMFENKFFFFEKTDNYSRTFLAIESYFFIFFGLLMSDVPSSLCLYIGSLTCFIGEFLLYA
jgi:hypothetical protein